MSIIKNPSFTNSPAMKEICDEYFRDLNLNLHYFGHGTVFPDGRNYCLNSDSEWAKWHLIEKELPPAGLANFNEIQNSIKLPHLNSNSDMGWSSGGMRFAKERFGIENLMVIFRKYDDRLESFFFDLHDKNAHEHFINHFDIFENFIFYYKDKAKDLLKNASENPLTAPEKYLNPVTRRSLDVSEKSIFDPEGITRNTQPLPKQYYLNYLGNYYSITPREYQCLSLLAHGAKINAIAEALTISPRTIDTHLINLKRKFNIRTLSEAVEIYWKNRIASHRS